MSIEPQFDVTSLNNRRADNRWERASIGDLLERVTWSYPDKEAIIAWPGAYGHEQYSRLTYRQADALANQVANGLSSRGLAQGDRVMLFCENSVEAYITKIGVAKAGMVVAPVNPSLAPDVVAHLIDQVEPAFSMVDAALWPRVEQACTEAGLSPDVTIPIGGEAVAGSSTFAEFVADCATSEPDVRIHGDDIWEILFTSGTTAMPKGPMISHHSTYYSAYSFALSLTRGVHLECDMRLGTFLPIIYHSGDQIFTFSVFLSCGTLVIGRAPDPKATAEAITREGITALWGGSPAMVNALAATLREDRLSYDARTLKVVVYGWAALPQGTLATLKQLCGEDIVVFEIFGQTESISCHRFWPDKWPEIYQRTAPKANYVGVPNPSLASTVMDDDGNSLTGQPDVIGEAVYRSPAITAGYYKDLEATQTVFRYGWFHSGDSCIYDENDLRIMVDRSKDIVKSGGENVSSIRVESVLNQHAGVEKAAVIGLPHGHWGEAVTAIVIASAEGAISEDELIAHCRDQLAGFETPKGVTYVDALPETVGGKVLKYKLRQRYENFYN